jgi:Domain of unknown function (DUF6766)
MRRFLRDNSLSLLLAGLFLMFWVLQSITGWHAANADNRQHHQRVETYRSYLVSGHFLEATAENWESEFLQMSAYVFLTAHLFQRGSPESKPPDGNDREDDEAPQAAERGDAPSPVRRGGLALAMYRHSLSLVLFAVFLACFAAHAVGGRAEFDQEQIAHGEQAVSVLGFMTTSQFWFQSFQNWQSEFFAVAAVALLGIRLRERGSPESKPVTASHTQTGSG